MKKEIQYTQNSSYLHFLYQKGDLTSILYFHLLSSLPHLFHQGVPYSVTPTYCKLILKNKTFNMPILRRQKMRIIKGDILNFLVTQSRNGSKCEKVYFQGDSPARF
jgi:hypothetical protein